MAESGGDMTKHGARATHADITGILGQLDDAKVVAVLALQPTIKDVEAAAVWLNGDPDMFGGRSLLNGVAAQIVALLTENEEEDSSRAR